MKVVILAGGRGTRISEYTNLIPKPMIKVLGKPIILRIMDHYARFGHKDFYIATGYKSNVIKKYFKKKNYKKYNINLIYTGLNTMTGGRIKRLNKFLNETFLVTYGDGLSNINIRNLLAQHINSSKLITMSIVRPPARFGVLEINEQNVLTKFEEKPQLSSGWINGGFFVVEPAFLDLCLSDDEMLEREPINRALNKSQISAYKHFGFWKCMDTLRDKKELEKIFNKGSAPWLED